ncbi:MAG: FecR/PupR family sigma factor regulator [Sphingobium sp.]|nr:FecR/PupR family sigma factor regulator [Sphingobium sp.]
MTAETPALKRVLGRVVAVTCIPRAVFRRLLADPAPVRSKQRWSDDELRQLRRESFDHLNRLLSGTATTLDAEALRAWRNRSPAHEAAFQSVLRLRHQIRFAVSWPDDEDL